MQNVGQIANRTVGLQRQDLLPGLLGDTPHRGLSSFVPPDSSLDALSAGVKQQVTSQQSAGWHALRGKNL